jgi:hypothetical protein
MLIFLVITSNKEKSIKTLASVLLEIVGPTIFYGRIYQCENLPEFGSF